MERRAPWLPSKENAEKGFVTPLFRLVEKVDFGPRNAFPLCLWPRGVPSPRRLWIRLIRGPGSFPASVDKSLFPCSSTSAETHAAVSYRAYLTSRHVSKSKIPSGACSLSYCRIVRVSILELKTAEDNNFLMDSVSDTYEGGTPTTGVQDTSMSKPLWRRQCNAMHLFPTPRRGNWADKSFL